MLFQSIEVLPKGIKIMNSITKSIIMILVGFLFGIASCFAQEEQSQQEQEVKESIVIFAQISIMNVSSYFHLFDENKAREGAAPTN